VGACTIIIRPRSGPEAQFTARSHYCVARVLISEPQLSHSCKLRLLRGSGGVAKEKPLAANESPGQTQDRKTTFQTYISTDPTWTIGVWAALCAVGGPSTRRRRPQRCRWSFGSDGISAAVALPQRRGRRTQRYRCGFRASFGNGERDSPDLGNFGGWRHRCQL
jgi:hypothetical protein